MNTLLIILIDLHIISSSLNKENSSKLKFLDSKYFQNFEVENIILQSEIRNLQDSYEPTTSSNKTSGEIIQNNFSENNIYPPCKLDSDCSDYGKCNLNTTKCECFENYVTAYEVKWIPNAKIKLGNSTITVKNYTGYKYCNWEKREQSVAFLLSSLVGFGTEHFYLGRVGSGVAKLFFYFLCGFLNITFLLLYKCIPGGQNYIKYVQIWEGLYLGCGSICLMLWYIYDLVMFGYNDHYDGMGIKLNPWQKNY